MFNNPTIILSFHVLTLIQVEQRWILIYNISSSYAHLSKIVAMRFIVSRSWTGTMLDITAMRVAGVSVATPPITARNLSSHPNQVTSYSPPHPTPTVRAPQHVQTNIVRRRVARVEFKRLQDLNVGRSLSMDFVHFKIVQKGVTPPPYYLHHGPQ